MCQFSSTPIYFPFYKVGIQLFCNLKFTPNIIKNCKMILMLLKMIFGILFKNCF